MLFIGINSFGQKETKSPPCATDELMSQLFKENPELKLRMDMIDNKQSNINSVNSLLNIPTITIPIIIYVVHDNQPLGTGSNISDLQVIGQIDALNNYFNVYGINFCLATKSGSNPISYTGVQNTLGIIHVNHPPAADHNIQTEQQLLASTSANSISPNRYLRIWVVKSINNPSDILGYSALPGTSTAIDGIVMRYDAFGDNSCNGCNFNLLQNHDKGKTLVHEIGHYLGLYHTFQEGCSGLDPSSCNTSGDKVCDTPPVASPNFNCTANINSCNEQNNLPDDIHNFMDYGDDNCLDHFTSGQKSRIFNNITFYRNTLFSSDNLIYTGVCGFESSLSATFEASIYSPCWSPTNGVSFTPLSTGGGTTYLWNFGDPSTGNQNTSTLPNPTHIFSSSSNTPYTVTLTITRGSESKISNCLIFVTNCNPIQNSESTWYFSKSNGLSFNTGVPIENNSIPASNTFGEACAIQSNTSGDVLFYTNSEQVWNSSHQLINTGNLLQGHQSSKNGAVIVPNPANINQYYIFTSTESGGQKGFRYSIVQTSGTTATMTSVINQPITIPSGYLTSSDGAILAVEGIEVFKTCNGYWIITSAKKSSGVYLIVYSLTSAGLQYTSEFFIANNVDYHVSSIEISPNGNKLAYINYYYKTYLFDFDKYTGIISNQILVTGTNTYAFSFSPNSNLFYLTLGDEIFQYNINSINIVNSKVKIGSYTQQLGGMQRGPDNKLYLIINGKNKMAVIHEPNRLATENNLNECFFTENGPILSRSLGFSLPNMIENRTDISYNNTISATPNSCFTYKFAPNVCTNSFSWNFGDPASGGNNISNESNPTHTFSGYGTYTITLNTGTISITYSLNINTINPVILGSTTACLEGTQTTNHSVALALGQNASWSVNGGVINGLNNQSDVTVKWTSLPGTVTLTITNTTGCSTTVTKTITSDCNNQATCDTNLTFNNPQTAAANYQASQNINTNTNYIVNNDIDINLKAGNSIVISPNAHIKNGSTFRAYIGPCTQTNTGKQSSKKSVEANLNSISIYPNPTSGIVTIELSNTLMTEITLNSIDGKLVHFKKTANVNYYSLDLSSYEKGIYLLNLKTSEGEFITKKIIKQ